jgi:hypothetical protein
LRDRYRPALETLLHEMVHQWNRAVGLRDSSPRHYHNVHFRDAANLLGLECHYSPSYGYSHTTLGPRAKQAIRAFGPNRRLFARASRRTARRRVVPNY